jgi:hypothetical protein
MSERAGENLVRLRYQGKAVAAGHEARLLKAYMGLLRLGAHELALRLATRTEREISADEVEAWLGGQADVPPWAMLAATSLVEEEVRRHERAMERFLELVKKIPPARGLKMVAAASAAAALLLGGWAAARPVLDGDSVRSQPQVARGRARQPSKSAVPVAWKQAAPLPRASATAVPTPPPPATAPPTAPAPQTGATSPPQQPAAGQAGAQVTAAAQGPSVGAPVSADAAAAVPAPTAAVLPSTPVSAPPVPAVPAVPVPAPSSVTSQAVQTVGNVEQALP